MTQRGPVYELIGFESQCGGNLSLPASGVAVPQANGTIFFGVTSINERGHGLHTRGFITLPTLSGTWSDNAGHQYQHRSCRWRRRPVRPRRRAPPQP